MKQLSTGLENSVTMNTVDIANLIQMLKRQHKEQMDEQARKHAEQTAVLIELS